MPPYKAFLLIIFIQLIYLLIQKYNETNLHIQESLFFPSATWAGRPPFHSKDQALIYPCNSL